MPWFNTDWGFRKELSTDSSFIPSNQSAFPVLLHITDTDLRDDAQNSGDDILFTDSDEVTQLNHEIETYDGSTGELWAWIRVPTLDSTGQSIYMYYGNSGASNQENVTGTWNSNYQWVHHLEESSGQAIDSTSNNFDSDAQGATQGVAGPINSAYDYDGSVKTDFTSGTPPLDGASALTISAWINSDSTGVDASIQGSITGTSNDNSTGYRYDASGFNGGGTSVIKLSVRNQAGSNSTGETASNSQTTSKQFLIMTWAAGEAPSLFIDAAEASYTSSPTTLSGNADVPNFYFGAGQRDEGGAAFWAGLLDEMRASNVKASQDWITSRFNIESNPSNGAGQFWTVGPEETAPNVGSVLRSTANGVLEANSSGEIQTQ